MRRGFLVLTLVVMAAIAAGMAMTVGSQTSTPADTASPAVSPAASPGASPIASPVGTVGDVERGRRLAAQCLGCHTTDGTDLVGPTWQGLYGSQVELESGETVTADEAYLHESIVDSTAKIVKGFPPAMPSYAYLTEQEVADLIAYIKSLTE